ncbi:MAG: peptidoglycan DD-metalloendopeptidase family protein, partial [Pseudomonadota bacterium]|nr:peptidoglycan DD-metalloendopeptidase family protein [Pseudomonadota bacterium]
WREWLIVPAYKAAEKGDFTQIHELQKILTAPYDGRILYSGAFRQYGGIVILGIDGNYQMILAGMEAPHSYVGQEVLTGEPLGNLPQGSGSLERSRLYLELRYNGRPIDPAPWIKNEKRSG